MIPPMRSVGPTVGSVRRTDVLMNEPDVTLACQKRLVFSVPIPIPGVPPELKSRTWASMVTAALVVGLTNSNGS